MLVRGFKWMVRVAAVSLLVGSVMASLELSSPLEGDGLMRWDSWYATERMTNRTMCTVSTVHKVNKEQLNLILEELMNTTFFRIINIDLDGDGCPLEKEKERQKQREKESLQKGESESSSVGGGEEEEVDEGSCGMTAPVMNVEGLVLTPQGGESAPPSLCTLEKDESDPFSSFSNPFGGPSSSPWGPSSPSPPPPHSASSTPSPPFASGGSRGKERDRRELEAEVQTTTTPLPPWLGGYTAPEARGSFVDRALSKSEKDSSEAFAGADSDCSDDEDLERPDFFINICEPILSSHPGAKLTTINLARNEEQYTGYNGSDVWGAIHGSLDLDLELDGEERVIYEEEVLQRLFRGMHTSINTHVALRFFPPFPGKRDHWLPNPQRFVETVAKHSDRVKNLHFAYVVLLRALRKLGPSLLETPLISGADDDDVTNALMRRLLETSVLRSCSQVFEAFDESLMFQSSSPTGRLSVLKKNFKAAFHTVSKLFNCVKCERCRLHGKVQLMGIGAALKILLLPDDLGLRSISKDELVALLGTAAKFSEAIAAIEPLAAMAEREQESVERAGTSREREQGKGAEGKAVVVGGGRKGSASVWGSEKLFDVAVVGGGLGGLSVALTALDRGASVVVIEKERFLGGNSVMASSGINVVNEASVEEGDSVGAFVSDIARASRMGIEWEKNPLVTALANGTAAAAAWVRDRVGLDFSKRSQLGGHTFKRTNRPPKGLAGAELVKTAQSELEAKGAATGRLQMMKNTKVVGLLEGGQSGRVMGVRVADSSGGGEGGRVRVVLARNVVLATGGFSADTVSASPSDGGAQSLMKQFREDLLEFPTTNNKCATGDGMKLGLGVGGQLVDMDSVQLHPTAFVDPKDPTAQKKTLCAEMLRGEGGILLNAEGDRFANELGPRDYVTQKILEQGHPNRTATLILSETVASKATYHVPVYSGAGLLREYKSLEELAAAEFTSLTGSVGLERAVGTLRKTLEAYDAAASLSVSEGVPDQFGKKTFPNAPSFGGSSSSSFFAGTVTPALHYTQGGLLIDEDGRVLRRSGTPSSSSPSMNSTLSMFSEMEPVEGLFAVGEVTGGLHGRNRLGGNGMTECVVFGLRVAQALDLSESSGGEEGDVQPSPAPESPKKSDRAVSEAELESHGEEGDCWMCVEGVVYDVSNFASDHPGGKNSVERLCGKDGTEEFSAAHSLVFLDDFEVVGRLSVPR
uniref:Cytochrome b5 heme-binding domain-containing protein n=1 Tax=Chromera velia CCMP2878 TaxID=1169474 RepID=A0A0G4GP76_9ALVE|eukprot:Cvel_22763.t1-p1 / transcript=Cvel_22763.t1 / gene=Cvel_22763 / organism=Chromera_velia_CCMP2878 / gene_product=Putative fumarate reductase, putative / transcript_product=Putative fumarate reductase, putative / location=Cvel_scaffold2274:2437-15602(+) / protein_length=1207 / sequence_SO=supercontig / SO=protein_coding / is_pseudo=false